MKKLYIFVLLIVFTLKGYTQNNLSTSYSSHGDVNNARYQPSELDLGDHKFQVGMNYYLWTGNTSLSYEDINKSILSDETRDLSVLFEQLEDRNLWGAGQDFQVLSLAYQHETAAGKKYTLSFGVTDKFASSFDFSSNTLKFLFRGNKQFAGQTVNIGDFKAYAHYLREYGVGIAFPLIGKNNGNDEGFGLRVGGRLKYIQGMAALQTNKTDLFIHTASDGSYIDLSYDYDISTSGMSKESFSAFNFNGHGVSTDLGVTAFLGKKVKLSANITDLGVVSYSKGVKSYESNKDTRLEGAIISEFFGDVNLQDSVEYLYSPESVEGGNFTTNLGGKVFLQAALQFPKTDNKNRDYISHSLYVTYIQGLSEAPGITTRPFVGVAYNHDFHKVFDIGVMAGMGGFNKYSVGAFASISPHDRMKIAIGSDNITGLISPKNATGIDGSISVSYSF